MQIVSRFRGIVAVGLFLLTIVSTATAKYSGGTGEPNDPYQIATAADLIALGETPEDYGKHFILTADIDLDPNLPGRKVFDNAVIAPDTDPARSDFQGPAFSGVFDGNGGRILHLTITGKDGVGLFGNLGYTARVFDLGLEAVEVSGTGDCVGGFVGINGGSIARSYSSGSVSGNRYVGGLVGRNDSYGSISTNYSSGSVSGKHSVGGLVGYTSGNTSTATSYSSSTVNGTSCVGGFVGYNCGDIVTSYSTGSVSGTQDVGGLVGCNWSGSIRSSFWDIKTSGRTTSDGGTGLTTAKMQDTETFLSAGWDFVAEVLNGTCDYWRMSPGDYPRLDYRGGNRPLMPEGLGTAEQPYLIRDARDLGTVWFEPMAHYRLARSVNLSGITWSMAVIPWFGGSFDGDGYVISHLHIQGIAYLGLFGQLGSTARVSNLGLEAAEVSGGGAYVGGLAGFNSGHIARSYSTGTVSGRGYEWGGIGGLVGENSRGSIVASYSSGSVSGTGSVGGLVGSNRASIATSCSTGSVSGTGDAVGGLVGRNGFGGNVSHCYSTASVSGRSSVGGLVGSNPDRGQGAGYPGPGQIVQCYSAGPVFGEQSAGGFVGYCRIEVQGSFWDTETSGQRTSAGGLGKTTTDMQTASTFLDTGWDFLGETANGTQDIWWIADGKDYPRLSWQYGQAFGPNPVNGASEVVRAAILQWKAGGPSCQHDIYFANDKDLIADAARDTLGIYCGRQAAVMTVYDPGILEWGRTYYWRIDEVNEADTNGVRKGSVWSFTTTDCIKSPAPWNGAVDVIQPTVLSWVPAESGLQYDVYFGEDQNDVTGATPQTPDTYCGRQPSESAVYDPDRLELNKTYYWRIDGVNEADPNSPWKGVVWSFTTADVMVVNVIDDFESYTDEEATRIYEAWIDGYDNGTGSCVGHDIWTEGTPYTTIVETEIIYGGKQSMPMDYDNTYEPWYSEAERTWATPQDWTTGGADTLTFYFRGEADNSPEPLYVGIEDSAGRMAVVVHPDAEAVLTTEWQKWHIALDEVRTAGVDVAAVKKMVIGVGDRKNSKPGGTGRIYIDDIRLTKRMP